jgi:ribosome-associated toxin RatA of RatAB toxin-antitoxin module
MKSTNVLERDEAGRGTLVEVEIDSTVTKNHLTLRFDHDEPSGMTWTRESGDLKSLDGSWTFEDLGGERTRATYALEIGLSRKAAFIVKAMKGPVEGRVRSLLIERPVQGLKEQAER